MPKVEPMASKKTQEEPDQVSNEHFIVLYNAGLDGLYHRCVRRLDGLILEWLRLLSHWLLHLLGLLRRSRIWSDVIVIVNHIPSVQVSTDDTVLE